MKFTVRLLCAWKTVSARWDLMLVAEAGRHFRLHLNLLLCPLLEI